MVEFGLKLQDNQVSEWSEYYIAYHDLKALLKKVKQAIARYEDQAKKKPALAAEIKTNYDRGIDTFITKTPPISSVSLASMGKSLSGNNLSGLSQQQQLQRQTLTGKDTGEPSIVSETTSLLSNLLTPSSFAASGVVSNNNNNNNTMASPTSSAGAPAAAASTNNELQPGSPSSTAGVHGVVNKALSSVSGYFEKRYETSLRDYLREIDALESDFDQRMEKEAEKVNTFYDTKLEELEKRLSHLTDSVVSSLRDKYDPSRKPSMSEDDDKKQYGDSLPPTPKGTPKQGDTENDGKKHVRLPSLDWRELMSRLVKKSSSSEHGRGEDKNLVHRPVLNIDELDGDGPDALVRDKIEVKKISEADSIQRALVDQYRSSKLLHNFAIMNYTGFVKIAKKHDKTLPHRKGKFKELTQPHNICDEGKGVEKLSQKLELRYANWFCDGNSREAMAQLLPKRGDGLETDWSQLRLGYRMGMCAVLGLWVCWDCVWGFVTHGQSTIGGRTAFPVFRACGGLLILQWCWGCSVFVWTRYRVNYIYLFDFDPRIVSSPLSIFNEAVDNTLVFLWCMLLYYKAGAHDIPDIVPSGTFPFVLVVYTVLQLIFPLRTRVPMWKSMWAVITSPSTSPSFYHGYVGDIFTSMVKVFQDIAWTTCFVASGDWLISEDLKEASRHEWSRTFWYKNVLMPILCLLPLLFRFNQCLRKFHDTGKRWPHLANATKYALSQTVTLFGAFHPLYMMHRNPDRNRTNWFQVFWMAVFVASSLYSFTWDVFMDWGLGLPKYQMLGPRLMYPKRIYYYQVIALDLVLRFMWVLTLLPPQSGAKFEVPNYLTALVMMLELFRRTIWGFLRLENEHRSNTAGFRRVSFVPLHFNTGHNHKYKEESQHKGTGVLAEVAAVAAFVLLICVYSVVSAQRATRGMDNAPDL